MKTLKTQKNKIIEFVNKYGLLTETFPGGYADSFSDWFSHVNIMSFAIYILELIEQSNIQKLKNIIHMEKDNFIYIPSGLNTAPRWASIKCQTPPQSELEAAYGLISSLVNTKLKDCVSTNIISNSRNSGVDMVLRPKDSVSALWLQFAHALSRNLEFKQCAACSTFFEVKSKKRKNEKIYCSDRCRVRVGARKRREKEKAS